tara:strand:+ start:208 stop:507 length:300 start_codon:yes stop_codon:yes gene_type:complete
MGKDKPRPVTIRVPLRYATIEDGWVELELLTANAVRQELRISKYIWDDWRRKDAIQSYKVDRTERLYDWHQLDSAALGDGPVRDFLRNRSEPIEEANHG